jgi:hypothetical protein
MPDWLTFFIRLGELVGQHDVSGCKTCAVLVPPVRSFAAVFCATGAVTAIARSQPSIDLEAHFASLALLTHGSQVVVKVGERIFKADFLGVEETAMGTSLKVSYGGLTNYVPKKDCQRVQLGSGGKKELPKTASAPSRRKPLEEILGSGVADQYLSIPAVDVVLVGEVALLKEELTRVRFRPSRKLVDVGTELFLLLRPSRLLPEGGISRSLLVSSRVGDFAAPVNGTPGVVVFDGGRSFSRHRSNFPNSSWIAILDRCGSSFGEGVSVANAEFSVRSGAAKFEPPKPPSGTEMQVFSRR